jgi:hypothetical protein
VDHVGELPPVVQRPSADGVGEDLVRVVSSELDPAKQRGQGGGATWAEHDRGGHFPAVAEPQLLAETLRDAFRPLRS